MMEKCNLCNHKPSFPCTHIVLCFTAIYSYANTINNDSTSLEDTMFFFVDTAYLCCAFITLFCARKLIFSLCSTEEAKVPLKVFVDKM